MIGVPLSGGKTLNVTFRSLNTRGDVFHSYTQTAAGSSPNGKKPIANEGLRGLTTAACITSSPANSPERSRKGNSSLPPPSMQSNNKNNIRGAAAEQLQQSDERGLGIGEQRKEELKKVVQLGVMRGLSSHRQTRKNSRTSRLMAPVTEKTYMQIRMRNDGVVPFQNMATQHGHQMMQPFYLTGVSGFYNATGASNRPHQNNTHSQNRTGRIRDVRGLMATTDNPRATVRKNILNVSQMGSQTSTDKFGDGGTKNTQTNQSMNETFELTNMIGGASIEMQDNERNRSVDINSQAFAQNTLANNVLAAQQQQHQHYSKLEEANSSIDQPSFQTEHEATFLWNNAKIIQNSLGSNSRGHLAERSPSRNQLSLERNSFAFDSFMGQQKSHNLSLDSPRRVAGGVVVHERGELIHSQEGHAANIIFNRNGVNLPHMVAQPRGQNNSLSPRLPGVMPQTAQNQQQLGIQQMNRKNKDLQGYSIHSDQMKVSSTLSPRKQISARESIQERFMAATMHQLIPCGVTNQLGPIQGHSMQLAHNQQESKKTQGVTQEPASNRQHPEQQENQSIKDYEAMILAQPSKHSGTDEDQQIDESQQYTAKRVSKISVDDVRGASNVERGLSKTETQVGVGGDIYESATQSQAEGQESPLRIANQKNDSVAGGLSPESVLIPAITTEMTQKIIPYEEQQPTSPEVRKDGGVAIGRFQTIYMNEEFSTITPARPLNDSINLEDCVTITQANETTQFENEEQVEKVQQVIACEITASHDDKNGKIHSTTIRHGLEHQDRQGVGSVDNIKQHVIPSIKTGVANMESDDRDNRRGSMKQQVVSS